MNQPYKTPRLYQAYILVAQGYLHATLQDGDGAVAWPWHFSYTLNICKFMNDL